MKNMIIAALFTFSQIAFAGPSGVDVKAGNQMSGMLFRENHSLNAGFEANNENNVTDSSGIATVTSTSPISGNYSLAIDATTSGELVKILGKTIKQVGTSCESVFYYTGDATLYKAYVLQGATKVSQELTLSNVGTNVQPVSLIFPCGAGTAPDVTIESTGNGAAIKVDDFYSGMPVNIGTVAQARFFGGMEQAGASGCNYLENTSTSTTDFKDLGTGTGCSVWTIDSGGTGNISAFGTNDHRLIASNLPAGRYSIEYIGQVYTAATGLCNYRLNDGTNTFQNQTITSGSGAGSGNALKFSVQYSTAQTSITFKIQAADNQASGCGLINDTASGTGASWKIYYFPSQSQTVVNINQLKTPTIQKFTSGSGTYTTPAGVTHIRVRMVGGGSGGGGGGTNASTPTSTAGGNTTFGSSLLTANGGAASAASPGSGGTCALNSPAIGTAIAGGSGTVGADAVAYAVGGSSAPTPFGGAASGGTNAAPGGSAQANTGSGGGGGGGSTAGTGRGGAGGSAGCFIDAIIPNPSTSYSYAIGTGGSGGSAGTGGTAGGAGGSGYIEVTEYYAYNMPLIPQSVISPSNGVEKVYRANVTCSNSGSTINSQSGTWLTSPTNGASAGLCSFTMTSIPADCSCSIKTANTTNRYTCHYNISSSTLSLATGSNAGFSNEVASLVCMGAN